MFWSKFKKGTIKELKTNSTIFNTQCILLGWLLSLNPIQFTFVLLFSNNMLILLFLFQAYCLHLLLLYSCYIQNVLVIRDLGWTLVTKDMMIFESILTTFEESSIFWGRWVVANVGMRLKLNHQNQVKNLQILVTQCRTKLQLHCSLEAVKHWNRWMMRV